MFGISYRPAAVINLCLLAGLTLCNCSSRGSSSHASMAAVPAPVTIVTDENARESSIRFLEERVKRDPEDFITINKLFGYYFQMLRETGSLEYLTLASRAANSSLATMPAEQNTGGLIALAQSEFAAHEFAASRDHAVQLTRLDPGKAYAYQMKGDALLEIGDYESSDSAYEQMRRLGSGISTETRLARVALLRGDVESAEKRFSLALAAARDSTPVERETVAWCYWQLGETAFSVGEYDKAEQRYRDSLKTFPDYYRALASLGRVLAARGDTSAAIEQYEKAVKRLPEPSFVAALGDLYKLSGRERDAAAQYALIEQISHLSVLSGVLYNRTVALFYADHDLKPDEAYQSAKSEYEVRHDIYGADALAWTAFKAGKLEEAQTAITEALKLRTRDAKLFYHAGMIARAVGNKSVASENLKHALTLNPRFDPLQSQVAENALKNL